MYMVQYLQLLFKVSRYVLSELQVLALITKWISSAYSVRTPNSPQ